jgi:hypothetical protein
MFAVAVLLQGRGLRFSDVDEELEDGSMKQLLLLKTRLAREMLMGVEGSGENKRAKI